MDHEKDLIEQKASLIINDVSPKDILKLAYYILGTCAVIFVLSTISQICNPNSGIFESCKTIIPPIVTLVIGFYFGRNN